MSEIIIRKAQPKDYSAIIELQNANTPDQLTEKEKKQGFVISAMTESTLDTINKNLGVLVAIENEQLAGFVCLDTTNPLPKHPVVKAMYHSFPHQIFNGKSLERYKVFIYGPVLINSKWRGRGILKKLFSAVVDFTGKDYDLGVAFINDKNPHSLSAHVQGLGMVALGPFSHEDETFQLVVFPV